MTFRLAAYAVCIEDGRVLLVRAVSPEGEHTWTLPGGRVEHGEDPLDTVTRELVAETGRDGVVERLLGVDSRVIPAAEARLGAEHHNVGIFYDVRLTGGALRPEPNGDTAEPVRCPIADVLRLRRSSLVDVGLRLAQTVPANGHVDTVPVGGLLRHRCAVAGLRTWWRTRCAQCSATTVQSRAPVARYGGGHGASAHRGDTQRIRRAERMSRRGVVAGHGVGPDGVLGGAVAWLGIP